MTDATPPAAPVADKGGPPGIAAPAWMARGDLVLLLLLMALAAVLRLWWAGQPLVDSYSWRQASTAMMADNFRLGSWNIFYPEVSWVGPGPGYQGREFQLLSYVTAILHAMFGWHDWFGRLVAIAFSMVTILSLHRLVAEIWDETHAHAAALIYAIMPAAITIDSSFLPDPAMLALVTLGIWLFVRYWKGVGGNLLLFLSALAFTLGVLSKLPGIAAGAAVLYLLIVAGLREGWKLGPSLGPRQGPKPALLQGVIPGLKRGGKAQLPTALAMAVSLGLVVAYYSWAIYLGRTYPPYHVAGSGYIWDQGLQEFLARGFYLRDVSLTATWWHYGMPLILIFALGLWMSPPKVARDRVLAAVPLVWLISFCLLYLAAAREIANNPWNLHVFSIPFAIFAGRGLVVLVEIAGAQSRSAVGLMRAIALTCLVFIFWAWPLVHNVKEPRARDGMLMGMALHAQAMPGDLAILISPDVGDPVAIYYARTKGWVFPPGGAGNSWNIFRDDDAAAMSDFETLRAAGAQWFGYTTSARDDYNRLFVEHHAGFIAWLDATFEKVAETDAFVIYRL